jgi:glucosamine--fructose-6-phosphate aminotransferase (isomerizing)
MSTAPSIGSIYGRDLALGESLFLIVSQSGQSPDLVANAHWAKHNGAFVVAVVNDVSSPVAAAADEVLPLHAGAEASVAATKTYIASLAALAQLPGQLSQALALDWNRAIVPFASAGDLLVVGRGLSFGIANEAALKFKETAAIHAEAFSGAELMHGPLALVRERYPLLVFSQDDETRPSVEQLLETLRAKGARVYAAQAGEVAHFRLPVVHGMHPATAPLAMIQTFYLLANAVALARGFNPDHPPHLRKVTETQ